MCENAVHGFKVFTRCHMTSIATFKYYTTAGLGYAQSCPISYIGSSKLYNYTSSLFFLSVCWFENGHFCSTGSLIKQTFTVCEGVVPCVWPRTGNISAGLSTQP